MDKTIMTKQEAIDKLDRPFIIEWWPTDCYAHGNNDYEHYYVKWFDPKTKKPVETDWCEAGCCGQLQEILKVSIEPAPDKWDRLYNVDFFIKIGENYIGLQIKPVGDVSHIPQIFKEHNIQKNTHEKFLKEFGGNVFYIYSMKDGKKKSIQNIEVVKEIQNEIDRLKHIMK